MDGEANVPGCRQLTKALTALLLPGKAVDEGQLQGAMTLLDDLVEESGIVAIGRESGDSEANAAHAGQGIRRRGMRRRRLPLKTTTCLSLITRPIFRIYGST